MRTDIKFHISKLSLIILITLSALFILSTAVLALCAGLKINPFKESTSVFLISVYMGAIGLGVATFLLNIAINVSLIAETKVAQSNSSEAKSKIKFWLYIIGGITAATMIVILAGTVLSEKKYLSIVHQQANEVLNNNDDLLSKIGTLLSNDTKNMPAIADINKFLANQRADLPQLTLIYSGNFEGKMALYELGTYFSENDKGIALRTYYQCSKSIDCDYLKSFFSGNSAEILQRNTRRNDMFWIYFPFERGGSKFVFMFKKHQNYGKIGSI